MCVTLRDIVQRNFRPACSTHLERSVAWKQLSGDVSVQAFRVVVRGDGMASGGQATDLKKNYESGGMYWLQPISNESCHVSFSFSFNMYKIYPNTYNILEVRKPRDPNDLFFPLKFSVSMYYMTPSIRTRVTGGWHWCRAIESAEMVQGEASMAVQTSEVKMSVNKIALLTLLLIFIHFQCSNIHMSYVTSTKTSSTIPALCTRSMFNPQHLSDGTHVLLAHRDGAVYLVTTIPFSDHLEMFAFLKQNLQWIK